MSEKVRGFAALDDGRRGRGGGGGGACNCSFSSAHFNHMAALAKVTFYFYQQKQFDEEET